MKGTGIDYDALIRESFKRIAASHLNYGEDEHFALLADEYGISEDKAREIVNRGKKA